MNKGFLVSLLLKLRMFVAWLVLLSLHVQAADLGGCKGTVLQRRFALVQFGKTADNYIATEGSLPNICQTDVTKISKEIPGLLKNTLLCGSSSEKAVHYSCVLIKQDANDESKVANVIERCNYSLIDQAVSCENKSLVTVIDSNDLQ